MKPIYLLFLFLPFCIKAQFTYQDLKKSVDATTSEASRIFKSKGFTFLSAEDDEVKYSKKDMIISKYNNNGRVSLFFSEKNNEKNLNNILETILKLGYKEKDSLVIGDRFCTFYESTNYIALFCDGKITYSDYTEAPLYSIDMVNKNY